MACSRVNIYICSKSNIETDMNISYGIDFDFSITWEEMGKQKRIGLLNTDSYPPTLFLEAAYNSIFVLDIAI